MAGERSEPAATERPRGRGGRKRDPSRDAAIIEAALDVLAEVGYERLTMDLVASRAGAGKATLYRRWPSKLELVLDAAATIGDEVDPADLPDTGSLRGDFAAVFREGSTEEGERLVRIMGGLASVAAADPAVADTVNDAVIGPFVATQRVLIERAIARGEVPAGADVETVSQVTPLMTAFRLLFQRRPIDRDFLLVLVDEVVIPALRGASQSRDPQP